MHSWPYDELTSRATISAWGFGPAEILVLAIYDQSNGHSESQPRVH